MIKSYDSIAAMREDYISLAATSGRGWAPKGRDPWYGNETREQTLARSLSGDTTLVPQAETLLASLDTAVETSRPAWDLAPAGAFVNIPAAIAGHPGCMYRKTLVTDDRAPITILACTTSSSACSQEMLVKRGTTILALVMALARLRPITLHQLTAVHGADNSGETVLTAQINTSPLDLATACYVLTSSGFARRLTYDLAVALNNFNGSWPRAFNATKPHAYFDPLIPRLGFDPKHTLIIPAAHIRDTMLSDPVTWVNIQVKRFTQTSEEPNV